MSIKDFSILAKLGEGAYSTVYKVERLADNQLYALKKVKLGNLSDKEAENALNQVRFMASIHHPNIVSYKEAFIEGKSLCIVMEFADDGDLYKKISDQKKKKKYFQESFIWRTIIQIIRGLKQLHELKIFHRDLKTANVFLTADGRAQLGDMNVSKIAQNGLLYTQTGTPYYASPEVWNEQPYDGKSDIWSLGCVIYEMTTLEVPFKAEDMEGLADTVTIGKFDPIPNNFSKELSNVISSMLQLKPKNRPTCDKLIRSSILTKKCEELALGSDKSIESTAEMLKTIYMPKKLQYLTDRLPKSNYSFHKSSQKYHNNAATNKPQKQQRERTNTLPKLDKILRYHEEAINHKNSKEKKDKKERKERINNANNNSGLLCVEGISKSIGEIKVGLPDRREKLQQEINMINQGKHQVYNNNRSRQNLPPVRR